MKSILQINLGRYSSSRYAYIHNEYHSDTSAKNATFRFIWVIAPLALSIIDKQTQKCPLSADMVVCPRNLI